VLTATEVALPENYREEIENFKRRALSRGQLQRRGAFDAAWRFLLLAGFIFGLITIIAALFGQSALFWLERPLLPLLLLAFLAYTLWQGWREGGEIHDVQLDVGDQASKVSPATSARQLVFTLDDASFALDHEHGRIFVTSDPTGRTAFFDVSTIADDPREAMAKSDALAAQWRWMDIPGTGFLRDAEAAGEERALQIYSINTLKELDAILHLLDSEDGIEPLNSLPVTPQTLETQIRSILNPIER